jgi:hypothetical protein
MIRKLILILVIVMLGFNLAYGTEIIQTNNVIFKGQVTMDTNATMNGVISSSSSQITFNTYVRLSTNSPAFDDMLSGAVSAYNFSTTHSHLSINDTLGGVAFTIGATTNLGDDHLTFPFQTPHRRRSYTHLDPHIHFWQTNADQTNCWYMAYTWVELGATNKALVFTGPATNKLAYIPGSTMHQLASFPEINNTNAGISSKVLIKLYRDGTKGSGTITVTDLDCHYEVDCFGSDEELSKK